MRIGSRKTDPDLILATDLDGTFLGGSPAERQRLYDWIGETRGQIGLIFVTGRDLPFVEQLCASGDAPWPDYVVGDVGTTIATVDRAAGRILPDAALEAPIAKLWNDQGDWVRETLEGAAGLTPQAGVFRYRMSYDYDPDAYAPDARLQMEAAGFDVLISANCFFDVLPRGVSKGPTLLRLLEDLEARRDRVLVAGDTLNDLSLFETGLRGVAVGNSEAPLVQHLGRFDMVHHARAHGAAGILEAIEAHGFSLALPTTQEVS